MKRKITEAEIAYLLDHLKQHYDGPDLNELLKNEGSGFLIPLSEKELDANRIPIIEEVPVLFPLGDSGTWFSQEGKRIRFHHDILKSAFFLLSGYQEFQHDAPDQYGRFPWTGSIQHTLGITHKPIVNYYFAIILDALEAWSKTNGVEFRRTCRPKPALFLSHDVDLIRKYSLRSMAYMALVLAGVKSSSLSRSGRWRNFLNYCRGTLLFRKDPYWNFKEIEALEKDLDIRSTWFFLEKTQLDNSRYHFHEAKIRGLISRLESHGHEVGIHGTLESSENREAMMGGIRRLNQVTATPPAGNRQHYLKFSNPTTLQLLSESPLKYDASLGFAERIGFRHSYAHPFRPYDFETCKAFSIWEIPLHVMDVSLTGYMVLSHEEIREHIRKIMEEVSRFRGTFALLWHNSHLDEEEFPGIQSLYKNMLEEIMEQGFESLTGIQVVKALKSSGA